MRNHFNRETGQVIDEKYVRAKLTSSIRKHPSEEKSFYRFEYYISQRMIYRFIWNWDYTIKVYLNGDEYSILKINKEDVPASFILITNLIVNYILNKIERNIHA